MLGSGPISHLSLPCMLEFSNGKDLLVSKVVLVLVGPVLFF